MPNIIKTISAGFSQGNTRKFRQNVGKQCTCVAMSLTAIIQNQTFMHGIHHS